MAVLIVNVDNNQLSTSTNGEMPNNRSELALMISRVAHNYSFVQQQEGTGNWTS